MDLFSALADPTRRSILELLAKKGPLPATAICERFQVSPQAISQHLKVLREAHLVQMEKRAQKRLYRVGVSIFYGYQFVCAAHHSRAGRSCGHRIRPPGGYRQESPSPKVFRF